MGKKSPQGNSTISPPEVDFADPILTTAKNIDPNDLATLGRVCRSLIKTGRLTDAIILTGASLYYYGLRKKLIPNPSLRDEARVRAIDAARQLVHSFKQRLYVIVIGVTPGSLENVILDLWTKDLPRSITVSKTLVELGSLPPEERNDRVAIAAQEVGRLILERAGYDPEELGAVSSDPNVVLEVGSPQLEGLCTAIVRRVLYVIDHPNEVLREREA